MQSQEKKIKKLIESQDEENRNLGQLALLKILDKNNVIHWYILLEKTNYTVSSEVKDKITELLGWSFSKTPMESLDKMVSFIQSECPSATSIETFISYYNNYLYNLMSHTWKPEVRKSVKSQIQVLNVSTIATKSDEDL